MKAVTTKTLAELVDGGIVQLTRGKIISRTDMAACPGPFPVYSSAKDNDGKFGEYGRFLFDEELITWSVDGGGRLFYRPKHKFSVTNVGGILRIRDRRVLDYKYLYYVLSLRHSEVSFDWVRKAHPSIIKKLYKNIPVPSLPDQQRIVSSLEGAFDSILTAKTNAEKNLENGRAIFKSQLQSVFTVRGKAWIEQDIGSLCDITHGFAFDGAEFSKDVPKGNPLVITPGNFTEDGKLLFNQKNTKRFSGEAPSGYRFDIGDLVVVMTDLSSKMKILGKPAFVETDDVLHNQRIGRVVFKNNSVEKRFLYYFMMSDRFLKNIKGSATGTMVKHTAPRRILTNVISYPRDQNEQLSIVAKFDALRNEIQDLQSIYRRKLTALEALKKSLLHKAFSGEQ